VGIIQMTKMEQSAKIDELLQRLEELKKKLNSGGRFLGPPLPQDIVSVPHFSQPSPTRSVTAEKNQPYPITLSRSVTEAPEALPPSPEKDSAPALTAEDRSRDALTIEDVRREWGRIVDEIRKKKISVGTILGESSAVRVADGTLQIACIDDFHLSSLQRNQMFLTEAVNNLLGSKLRIEAVLKPAGMAMPPTRPEPARKETPPNTTNTREPLASKEHPLIETLYRDFGAERI
jgi:hypothetical protein